MKTNDKLRTFLSSLDNEQLRKLPPSMMLMKESTPVMINFDKSSFYRTGRSVAVKFYKPVSQINDVED